LLDAPVEESPERNVMFERDNAPHDAPMRTVRYEISLSLRSFFTALAIVASLYILARVWESILILIVALVLAGTFSPVVTWLERHRVARPVALGFLFLTLFGVVIGFGALLIPALVQQVGTLSVEAPTIQARVADSVAHVPLLASRADAIRTAQLTGVFAPVGAFVLQSAGAVAQGFLAGFTTVVLAFYLIADHERVQGFAFALLPRRYHLRTARVLLDMERVVGGYMRGQAFTSLCIAVFAFALLSVLHVPSAFALAILAGVADLIPLVGGVLAVAPSVLFALTVGPVQAVVVLVAFVIYQQVESNALVPRVYGESLRLSPIAVTVALLFGGQLLGIIGALLALPVAAGIRVLVENFRIALPGELAGEATERAADAVAEADYAAQVEGTSAVEAAMVATAFVEQQQEAEKEETGRVEVPVEERGDPLRTPSSLHNPAQ